MFLCCTCNDLCKKEECTFIIGIVTLRGIDSFVFFSIREFEIYEIDVDMHYYSSYFSYAFLVKMKLTDGAVEFYDSKGLIRNVDDTIRIVSSYAVFSSG